MKHTVKLLKEPLSFRSNHFVYILQMKTTENIDTGDAKYHKSYLRTNEIRSF